MFLLAWPPVQKYMSRFYANMSNLNDLRDDVLQRLALFVRTVLILQDAQNVRAKHRLVRIQIAQFSIQPAREVLTRNDISHG